MVVETWRSFIFCRKRRVMSIQQALCQHAEKIGSIDQAVKQGHIP